MAESREYWMRRRGFILAAIGSAIGLGNIWRFSWLAYRNGGGAFLVPYFIALLSIGVPLLILEFLLGNYFQGSSVTAFKRIRDQLEIIGWIAILDVFIIGTYYSVVLGWVMDYIGYSAVVAWKDVGAGDLFNNLTSNPWIQLIGFTITWFITWITVYKGVSGGIERASTFAIPVLWFLSAILVIRGITLAGADVGINWYLKPDWARLADGKVWIDAFGQILFTLSVMAGPLVVYAKYMPRNSELPNSAWITAFANCGFSFFFGFATWGIIGYMMSLQGVTTPADLNVPLGGAGLAFVTIPTATSLLPGGTAVAAVFGTIFFIILWLAGYTSLISIVEPVHAALNEKFGTSRKLNVTLITILSYIIGLAFIFRVDLIDPVDFIAGSTNLVWVVLLEAVIASYFYSLKKLRDYANPYAELKLGEWFDFLIRYVVPVIMGIILVYGLISTDTMSPISGLVLILLVIASTVFAGSKWKTTETIQEG